MHYVKSWSHVSWAGKKDIFHTHKLVYIPDSEHFSFAKIIHPPDTCGISRSGLNRMVITQVHLVPGTIKGHFKMCSIVTQHNATDVSNFEGAYNWHADCRNFHQRCWCWGVFLSVIKPFWGGKLILIGWGLTPQWVGLCPPRHTYGCTTAQSCEIHRLGPNLFILIHWFPYMNCNSVKSFKLLHVAFFVQYNRPSLPFLTEAIKTLFSHAIAYPIEMFCNMSD